MSTQGESSDLGVKVEQNGNMQVTLQLTPELSNAILSANEGAAFNVTKQLLTSVASQITPTSTPEDLKLALETSVNVGEV